MAYAAALLRALTGKLQLRQALEKAYYSNDKAALELVARENIPETICRMEQVAAMFRENWLECARANGMERIQTRFAGQICRLQELQQRIGEFLTGKVSQIDELEHPLDRNLPPQRMNFYHRVSSGSNHI